MPHWCFLCGRSRANEKFSGKGHRRHICKDCWPRRNDPVPPDPALDAGRDKQDVDEDSTALKGDCIEGIPDDIDEIPF